MVGYVPALTTDLLPRETHDRTSMDTVTGDCDVHDIDSCESSFSAASLTQTLLIHQPLHRFTLYLEKNWWMLWILGGFGYPSNFPDVCSSQSGWWLLLFPSPVM